MVWKKRKKKESGAVSVIWWRMCLGNYGPGQNFNCQRTLTMFFFFFTCCTQQKLSFSLESYIHTYTVCLLEICQQSNTQNRTVCVQKRKCRGTKKKELAMAAIRERRKKEKRQLLLLTGEFFFKRSASVWFCEVSESFSCWVVLSLSLFPCTPSLFSIGKGFSLSCTKRKKLSAILDCFYFIKLYNKILSFFILLEYKNPIDRLTD